jgi:hypothetical protein
MIDFPQGRIPTDRKRDVVSTLLPNHQAGRNLARLLQYDAILQIQDGNRPEAARDCRAMLNVARVYTDESLAIAQLIRISIYRVTLRTVERLEAQRECPDAELQLLQQLLEEAAIFPTLLTMARGERGAKHYFFSSLASGDVSAETLVMLPGINNRSELSSGSEIRRIHARLLEYDTEFVAIAKEPTERQIALVKALDEKYLSAEWARTPLAMSVLLYPYNRGSQNVPSNSFQFVTAALRHQADLRSGVAALAVERYRLAHGAWPRDLAGLVPTYLKEVPMDPFDGQPLRYRRTESGAALYCVGPDGKDDQGTVLRGTLSEGPDIGFELWEPVKRKRVSGGDGR